MNISSNLLLDDCDLVEICRSQVVSGGQQHRYELRCTKSSRLVAWFCWYQRPGNPYRARPAYAGIVSFVTKHEDVPATQKNAAQAWLHRLEAKHPTT